MTTSTKLPLRQRRDEDENDDDDDGYEVIRDRMRSILRRNADVRLLQGALNNRRSSV
jgi:hypothetical protein